VKTSVQIRVAEWVHILVTHAVGTSQWNCIV
jgi:hypothetical protein